MMVPKHKYGDFYARFRRKEFEGQRFGQAFLNEFHDDPDVAAQRGNSRLWEETNPFKADTLIYSLNLIG